MKHTTPNRGTAAGNRTRDAILAHVRKCAQSGDSPTVREICDVVGLTSTSTVHAHLHALAAAGRIERRAGAVGRTRCWTVAGRGAKPVGGKSRDALVAAEQCIVDFLDVYKRGASMIVMDCAVRSLRDDALVLVRAALAEGE